MNLIINQGAGKVLNYGWEQAYRNIKKFIEDCEIELHIVSSNFIPEDDGRYIFKLESDEIKGFKTEIEMPSLPLEQVRYLGLESQDVWDFPRLYVDGSSWIWKIAIITKKDMFSRLENKIDILKEDIQDTEELMKQLKKAIDKNEN